MSLATHKSRDPHAHGHDAGAFVRDVARVCDERGLRLTAIRLRVLELVAEATIPVKAYDLLDRLKDGPGVAAPPTVYRALDFLLEHGFIHKLESINAFVGCHHPGEAHQVPFLICDHCSSAFEICDEGVAVLLTDQARERGFKPASQTLEVHGICARCSDQSVR
ncbi:transcriptional repressor [Dokdonella sp.]|uniref:transcriptional repressor n=1 Tax=Dokdonella sp. TaxID=2291710 RepID=UPI002BC1A9F8|nr:transcriptional repressor [Xanthomonadales bacterium]MBK7209011.1 transcriptional repressor [Xanthomonadales bacterium]HQX65355.1 transcriptional repressor [Dokdonella sp.]HQZ61339.1 transcriptional repressor [Dokdonella sp.]